ncbi:DUF5662 family protein [Adlercreutzia sp. ZJ473]|uniref:DUF5662 family protein n=1 Tax=Adlercreutzia sp. ZJ473 TaxID=2722822 RepID=UPI001C130A28|nr:DUF5662 family protein [Adlercreutzia sp. ZJ473]
MASRKAASRGKPRMKVAVSACLLGQACRYDGASKPCEAALALLDRDDVEVVPVCPEVAGGLPTPREPSEITHAGARWQVTARDGADVTDAFVRGAEATLALMRREGCRMAVLKAKSPSCGSRQVYDGTFTGTLRPGYGVTAKLLRDCNIFVIDETELPLHLGRRYEPPRGTLSMARQHLRTINAHKIQVMRHCFRVGLYKQGLLHDLSKYTPTEFCTGMRYYQGTRSPNTAEREERGFCEAWLHHKGRNRHHYEYWTDVRGKGDGRIVGAPMPTRYVVEMFCDRVAACKVYQGDAYTDASALEYYEAGSARYIMHPETAQLLEYMLHLLADRGEDEAFRIIRDNIVRARYTSGAQGRF